MDTQELTSCGPYLALSWLSISSPPLPRGGNKIKCFGDRQENQRVKKGELDLEDFTLLAVPNGGI